MLRKLLLLSSLIYISSYSYADIIRLTDGSRIFGTIKKVYKDQLTIETEFTGLIVVPMVHIDSYETDSPKNIEYGDNDTTQGKVKYTIEESYILPSKEDLLDQESVFVPSELDTIKTQSVLSLWELGTNHPSYLKPASPWEYKLYLNLAKQTGNSDKENYRGGGSIGWERDGVKLLSYGAFILGENNKTNNEEEYVLGSDYEHPKALNDPSSLYLRSRWEKDRFEDIQNRYDLAGGMGYYILDNDRNILRSRLGLAMRHEDYQRESERNNTGHGLEMELSFKRQTKIWGSVYSKVRYNPAIDDFNNYIINQESGYEIPFTVDDSLTLSLNMGMDQEYVSNPTGTRSKDDTKYFLRLGLTF
jgi:putative salt-induced outer membrane protein YdiY